MGVTTADKLVEAIKQSDQLDLNDKGNLVRRKGNKPLPGLNPQKRKQNKMNQAQEKSTEEVKKQEPKENDLADFVPMLFTLKCEAESKISWKLITEQLEKLYGIKVPYVRYMRNEGNFATNKNKIDQAKIDEIVQKGLDVEGTHLAIQVTEGEDMNLFKERHQKHLEDIIRQKKREAQGLGDDPQKKKKDRDRKKKQSAFKFSGEKYYDVATLKATFKGILGRTGNDEEIKEPYHTMLKELLQYHEKAEQKLSDLKYFTVGINPVYKDTRCFFIVRNDGSKEDFSMMKCLLNLENKLEQNKQSQSK